MIFDTGVTASTIGLLLVLLLGGTAVVGLAQAAVAVLVFGPRKWESMTLPGVAAVVTMVTFVLISRGPLSPLPATLVAGTLVAFLVAYLQRDSLEGGGSRAQRRARAIRMGGSILAWLLAGVAVGLVVGAMTGGPLPLLLFPLVGLLIALRPSARAAREGPPNSEEATRPPGMLDE
jgi:hypothetical protein